MNQRSKEIQPDSHVEAAAEEANKKRQEILNSLSLPAQVVMEPRTDGAPPCMDTIVAITQAVSETRGKLRGMTTDEIDGDEWHRQWHEHTSTLINLLGQFGLQQIKSLIPQMSERQEYRINDYLKTLQTRHPFDSVLHLFVIEPHLMFSNLSVEELNALHNMCRQLDLYGRYTIDVTALRLYAAGRATKKII